jgi:hypothetical protein
VTAPAPSAATRWAALPRARAAAVVVGLLVLEVWLAAGSLSRAPAPPPTESRPAAGAPAREGDAALYRAVVARMRAGETYYEANARELKRLDYPSSSVFNWRPPTSAWLLAALPSPLFGNALLALVGAAVVVLTWRWVRGSRLPRAAGAAAALMSVAMAGTLVGSYVFMQELWAGVFVALSVCLFARDRWRAGVAAGLAALAFRELALLPCVVGLVCALGRRRWPEVASWLAGLGAWAAFMAWHRAQVFAHIPPGGLARGGWVVWGGAAFVVETARWSPIFIALPRALVALALPFVLLGLAGWRDRGVPRAALIVVGYLAAFVAVGHPFNDYWGALYAPLLPLGLVAVPASVRELVRALRGRPITAS